MEEIQVGEFLIKFTQILPKTHPPKIMHAFLIKSTKKNEGN